MEGIVSTPDESMKRSSNKAADQKLDVYVWDMDETLILLKSLLNGTYAEACRGSKDANEGVHIGKMWEKYILELCDDFFFYKEIEDYNKPFIDALKEYDDGRDLSNYDFIHDGFDPPHDDAYNRKLAYRHRIIAHRYKQGLRDVLDPEMIKLWDELYEMTDKYTDRWLSSARAFLEKCSAPDGDNSHAYADGTIDSTRSNRHVNVLVTSGSLVPSIVKCLLFRLDNLLPVGNVYSSWEVGKLQCFRWIKERFGSSNVRFCAIGDGWEECEAAESMRWPFIKIDLHPGSSYSFPGLTLRTVSYYFSIVYGSPEAKNDED